MIVTVPTYKKIYPTYNNKVRSLNESIFDDDDVLDSDESQVSEIIYKDYEENTLKPKVEHLLDELEVENYEIKCTGNGIYVDVHDNLYLSNKHLDRMGTLNFQFDYVEGSCNYTGNNLPDWALFPLIIGGNCYCNFNNIKDFNGVPTIHGKLIANKQNKKPKYPLTDENYRQYLSNRLQENRVYSLKDNKYGTLMNINENQNYCIIKYDDETKQKCKLNEVEYISNLENLFI